MQFGIFLTNPVPRPWAPDSDRLAVEQSLDFIVAAEQAGFDAAWVVEQHFLEEYSHSSAPEMLLAAASQRTSRIRLGHAGVLAPPAYNHPARLAERIAMLDLLSDGRAELGWSDSKSRLELEGFLVAPDQRRAMALEAIEQIADMLALDPYPGYEGVGFSMPARNVVPKPLQQPHPPLWVTCSDDATMMLAARLGVGVLAHGFFDPDEARHVIEGYDETFIRECVPIGHRVNPSVAMVAPLYCHADPDHAGQVGCEAFGPLTHAIRHYYVYGRHRPGRSPVWPRADQVTAELGEPIAVRGVHAFGSPEQLIERLSGYAEVGLDQVILQVQPGRLSPDEVIESLRLFGETVIPVVRTASDASARRQASLAAHVEQALARKPRRADLPDDSIPVVDAYGRSRPSLERQDLDNLPEHTREILLDLARMERIASSFEQ